MARDLSLPAQPQGQEEERGTSPDRLHHSGLDDDSDDEGELLYRDFLSRRLATEMEQFHYQHQQAVFPGGPGGLYNQQNSRDRDPSSGFSSLAERFQRSGGREEVRRRADMVDISSINQENLTLMLTELFQDGVTQERLLVLFFFCSDLTLRAIRVGMVSLVSRLTDWVLAFIRSVVAGLVRCQGGWESLLSSLPSHWTPRSLAILSLSAAMVSLGALYLKKQL